jgi:hypothetical protein
MKTEMKGVLIIFSIIILASCQCGDDCLDCEPMMSICIACKGQLETDVFGKCHKNTVDKCTTYGPDGSCLRCQNTFTLDNG